MTQLGASPVLGDMDVLAWREGDRRLLCIECKRLRPARTVMEILEVLNQFRGDAKDRLGRHIARIEWLKAHLREAGRGIRASLAGLDVVPLLITNAVVPMQFVADLPIGPNQVLPLETLGSVLAPHQT
jgi:hypothetical protein